MEQLFYIFCTTLPRPHHPLCPVLELPLAIPHSGSGAGDCQCAVQNGGRRLLPGQRTVFPQSGAGVCGGGVFDLLLFPAPEPLQNAVHLSADCGLSADYPGDRVGACCAGVWHPHPGVGQQLCLHPCSTVSPLPLLLRFFRQVANLVYRTDAPRPVADHLAGTGVCDHSGADLYRFLSGEQRGQRFFPLLPDWSCWSASLPSTMCCCNPWRVWNSRPPCVSGWFLNPACWRCKWRRRKSAACS